MKPWKTLSEKTVYEMGPVSLKELSVLDPKDNQTKRVQMSLGGDTVLIIPRINNEFLLCEQFRVGMKESVLEFPNGGVENGESLEDAARRELSEEVGAQGSLNYLGGFYPLSGLVDLCVHVFLCECSQVNEQSLESYEDIRVVRMTLEEINKYVSKNKVVDGYLLSALALLQNS